MTWVIGAASLFGYGVMLSDVRVTFSNGKTAELLKKAYPVGPFIVAGFAGSVLIGFRLLESLRNFLILPSEVGDQNAAWQPQWVAHQWSPKAQRIFADAPLDERRLHSQFLIVGVFPNENLGAPEFPRVYVIRFSNPDFKPGFMRKAFTVAHIGSGGGVRLYKRAFRDHFRIGASSLRTEMAGPTGWASMLGHTVNLVAAKHPISSVSRHVHILICRLGEILEGNNNERVFPSDDSDPIEFKMPDVATSYDEFVSKCRASNLIAEAAVG
jgi:hypothetical protein